MLTKFYKLVMLSACSLMLLLPCGIQSAYAGNADEVAVLQSQQKTITGTVTDQTGEPVIGATIVIKGASTRHAITDAAGKYLIQASVGELIECSYLGYSSQSYKVVAETSNHDFVLAENAVAIEQVIVTALGIKREARALGYAAMEIDGNKLLETRQVNVTNALAGKVPGLQIVKGGGATSSSKIILRGPTSLTGTNQPLIIVDGVPIDNFSGGLNDSWGNDKMDYGNGLSDINSDDIESMTVLKGGASAALYGSRAGNGVILVTTKTGRNQKGLGITVSGSLATESLFISPKLQNSFAQGSDGVYNKEATGSWGPIINGTNKGENWQGKDLVLNSYDNVGSFFRTGIIDTESITFQQQVNRTSIYASLTRMNDASMIPETTLGRTSLTARATTNLGKDDRWKLDFKVNYVNSKAHNRPIQGINQANAYFTLASMPRSIDVSEFENAIDDKGEMIWWQPNVDTPQDSPWWTAKYNRNDDERNRFISFAELSYQFTPWLRGELRGGLDYYNTLWTRKKHTGGFSNHAGTYSEGTEQFREKNLSYLFIAQKDELFGDFGGSATFGGNLMDNDRHTMTADAGSLQVPNMFSLNNGVDKARVSSKPYRKKINSLYGSMQLNWKRALFLDATIRNDWSSTMLKENRSYMYPSISFSGVISDLVSMPSWFTFAKVRVSYAEVGNDLDPYKLYNALSMGKDIFDHPIASLGETLFDSNVQSELVKSTEAGIDVRFFDNRLRIDAGWYKSNSTRQLLQIPLDATSGYKYEMINAGNIQNEGLEFMIGASILRSTRGLNWDASFNMSTMKTKIIALHPKSTDYPLMTAFDGLRVTAKEGAGYGDIYGNMVKRVEDKDSPYYGRWILSEEGLPIKADNTDYLGNQRPKMMIGLTNSFSYRNIGLDLQVDARIGGNIYSLTNAYLYRTGSAEESAPAGKREDIVVNGVVSDGKGGYVENAKAISPQRYYRDALGVGNKGIDEMYVYDATNVRLRNISLSYELPKKLLAGTALQRVRASITGYNVWMIYSNVPGIDPECVSGTGTNALAAELVIPPTTRSFTFNITIGF